LRQRLTALPGGSDGEPEELGGSRPSRSDAARAGAGAGAGSIPLHIVRRWDRDARVAAWEQAQAASERDPDAAAHLLDCLSADPADPSQAPAASRATTDDGTAPDWPDRRNWPDQPDWVADDAADDTPPSPPLMVARSATTPFDPMRLLARVARYYRWSHQDILRTPWRTFLGYLREADIMSQEEKAAMDAELAKGRRESGGAGSGVGSGVPGYPA
jgi:hypothetical protein